MLTCVLVGRGYRLFLLNSKQQIVPPKNSRTPSKTQRLAELSMIQTDLKTNNNHAIKHFTYNRCFKKFNTITKLKSCSSLRGIKRFNRTLRAGLTDTGKKVITLVIDQNVSREIFDFDFPNRFHA